MLTHVQVPASNANRSRTLLYGKSKDPAKMANSRLALTRRGPSFPNPKAKPRMDPSNQAAAQGKHTPIGIHVSGCCHKNTTAADVDGAVSQGAHGTEEGGRAPMAAAAAARQEPCPMKLTPSMARAAGGAAAAVLDTPHFFLGPNRPPVGRLNPLGVKIHGGGELAAAQHWICGLRQRQQRLLRFDHPDSASAGICFVLITPYS